MLRRAENLNARLEEEMSGLRLKKRYSRFSFFIGYELNTKQQKQACLQDLLKAQSLEQLQEKAKGWSENRRVFRGWRNTCTQAWFQSRTGVLLEDIQNPCQERVLRSLSQVLAR